VTMPTVSHPRTQCQFIFSPAGGVVSHELRRRCTNGSAGHCALLHDTRDRHLSPFRCGRGESDRRIAIPRGDRLSRQHADHPPKKKMWFTNRTHDCDGDAMLNYLEGDRDIRQVVGDACGRERCEASFGNRTIKRACQSTCFARMVTSSFRKSVTRGLPRNWGSGADPASGCTRALIVRHRRPFQRQ